MVKKLIAIVSVTAMLVASMSTVAFATDSTEAFPNIEVGAYLINEKCIYDEEMDVNLIISKNGAEIAVIPLEYDEEINEFCVKKRVDVIDDIITDVGPDYDAWLESENSEKPNVIEEKGYQFDVKAEVADPEHELTVTDLDIGVWTAKSEKNAIDLSANNIVSITIDLIEPEDTDSLAELERIFGGQLSVDDDGTAYVKADGEEPRPIDFEDYINAVEQNKDIFELDSDDLEAIEDNKAMLAAIEAGSYNGEMTVDIVFDCTCEGEESEEHFIDEPKEKTPDGGTPDTGDDFNVLPFAVVMLLAALGMGIAVVRRRA